jgi:MFS family permease
VSGLLAAAFSPLAGLLAGRLGAIRVLTVSLAGAAVFGGTQALAADYGLLLVLRGCSGLVQSGMGPLIVSMIAAEVPEERRASVLNITLFPGYLAWLAGGILGSVIGSVSVRGVFAVAAGVVAAGSGMTMLRWRREDRSGVAAS